MRSATKGAEARRPSRRTSGNALPSSPEMSIKCSNSRSRCGMQTQMPRFSRMQFRSTRCHSTSLLFLFRLLHLPTRAERSYSRAGGTDAFRDVRPSNGFSTLPALGLCETPETGAFASPVNGNQLRRVQLSTDLLRRASDGFATSAGAQVKQ